jgi:hypothetical protein
MILDYSELLKPIFILNNNMTQSEKINTIIRFILFCGIILALILNNYKIALFVFIIIISLFYLNYYNFNLNIIKEKFNNLNNLSYVDNKLCVTPSKNNPLMNRNIYDNRNYDNCDIDNKCIKNKINKILNNSIYTDDYDIYNRNILSNIFYTVPNNNIINDQEGFAKWLYRDNETCKEEGGIECYNNLYTDLRVK